MSTNRVIIFCSCLLLFASSNEVLAFHHGGQGGIGDLLGGGLLTLLFARQHGNILGGLGQSQGRSAAGGLFSRGSQGGQSQGEVRTAGPVPHAHAMGIPMPVQAFHGPVHGHGFGVHGMLHAHGVMGGIPHVHGLSTHGPFYGGFNAGNLAYNPGFTVGGFGNAHNILGLQGLGIHGLDSTYFGHNLEGHFPISNMNGHYPISGADALTHSGISQGNFNTHLGGFPNIPLHNGASLNSAV